MLGLYYNAVLMCVISMAMCSPMPQHLFEDGPFQNQQKHAIDFFSTRLVGNPKVRRNYLNCFLDNGPCSPEAKNIKRMVPDAMKNECEHCTELQKKVIEKMMCYLNNNQPDILKQVAAKFDPNGEYMKQYIDKIEKDQFLNPQLQSPKNKFQPQPQQPQDQNQQQPHQNNHHEQNQPPQGQNQPDQDQNKNHHSQPDHQQPHQNHQPPSQNQPPSHHHPHQQPQNPNQQQPQNPPQQQPQNPHQQQPQNPHQQHPQNPHQQQPQNPHQQQPQNPHQQQPHHHHNPQQPQQNQQPQQH